MLSAGLPLVSSVADGAYTTGCVRRASSGWKTFHRKVLMQLLANSAQGVWSKPVCMAASLQVEPRDAGPVQRDPGHQAAIG